MVAEIDRLPSPAERVLVLTRVLDAPRSLVFAVWTRPEHLVRWWGPKGFTLPFCETDFRPGGAYRFCMRSPAGTDHWVSGVYREIVEPERIVFTWEREDAEGKSGSGSVVTVDLAEHEGKTKLTLHQAVFKSVQGRDEHQGGWTECLERLAEYVAKA
jgi:uncharacterized protein YndB with AHSA1/START domain